MADMDFFSGLEVAEIVLIDVSFRVRPDLAPGTRELGVSLGHEVRENEQDTERPILVLRVGVNDDDEQFEQRGFAFSATVSGVFGATGLAEGEDEKLFLLVNGLSLLYAEARSYLSQMSSSSPMGRVLLPSVNMLKYLRAVAAHQGEVECEPADDQVEES
jgi:preprotein translocase subunit SecB